MLYMFTGFANCCEKRVACRVLVSPFDPYLYLYYKLYVNTSPRVAFYEYITFYYATTRLCYCYQIISKLVQIIIQ